MNTYAAFYPNEVRMESSSGGIFSLIAKQYDVVYGVAMDDDCHSCHFIRVQDDIEKLRGSKYFQAVVGDTFKSVKTDLEDGRRVLFSGTGCQINGLSCFLGKDYPNLFLLDVVCHGVPSPKLWREYASFQESKYGKLQSVDFRCKDHGWVDFGMKENKLYISKDTDSFMRMFLRNYCLRPSCYECHAKNYKKADMTIADFWGIENVAPEMNDGNGTSLVICRTEKGNKLFDQIKYELQYREVSYEDGVRENPSEYSSVSHPKERDAFFDDLDKLSFEDMEKKYAADIKKPLYRRILSKGKRILKKILRGGVTDKKQVSNADYGMLFTFKKNININKSMIQNSNNEIKPIPILYERKEDCCGCTACYAICPKSAITMEEDAEGFLYPKIKEEKCIKCYRCIHACPIKQAGTIHS